MTRVLWPLREKPLERGCFKLVVLKLLEGRSLAGYEIIKEIHKLSHGLYTPSPGVVYPTLKALVKEGLLSVVEIEGKKLYALSERGRRVLEENRSEVEEIMFKVRALTSSEKLSIHLSLKKIFKLLLIHADELKGEKALKVARILEEARMKISKVLEE